MLSPRDHFLHPQQFYRWFRQEDFRPQQGNRLLGVLRLYEIVGKPLQQSDSARGVERCEAGTLRFYCASLRWGGSSPLSVGLRFHQVLKKTGGTSRRKVYKYI